MLFYSVLFVLFPSLLHAVINTPAEAIQIAPALLEKAGKFESILMDYKRMQLTVAALKLRSLVPEFSAANLEEAKKLSKKKRNSSFDSYSNHSYNSDYSNDSDSNPSAEEESFSSTLILAHSLADLMINSSFESSQTEQILAFDPATQSVSEIVAQMEAEAQSKLLEAAPILQTIKSLLAMDDPVDTITAPIPTLDDPVDTITAPIPAPSFPQLLKICFKAAAIEKRLVFLKKYESKHKSHREVLDCREKIFQLTQEITEILASS